MKANIKKVAEQAIKIQAFGGTAQTYLLSEPQGEPFKDGNAKYINIKHNGVLKKVRWYTDAEHHDAYAKWHIQLAHRPLYTEFFFTSETDKIQLIKVNLDVDEHAEVLSDFRAAGFAHRAFFGGCLIAPFSAKVPAGYNFKVETCDWPTLKKAGRANCSKQTPLNKEWFNE